MRQTTAAILPFKTLRRDFGAESHARKASRRLSGQSSDPDPESLDAARGALAGVALSIPLWTLLLIVLHLI